MVTFWYNDHNLNEITQLTVFDEQLLAKKNIHILLINVECLKEENDLVVVP